MARFSAFRNFFLTLSPLLGGLLIQGSHGFTLDFSNQTAVVPISGGTALYFDFDPSNPGNDVILTLTSEYTPDAWETGMGRSTVMTLRPEPPGSPTSLLDTAWSYLDDNGDPDFIEGEASVRFSFQFQYPQDVAGFELTLVNFYTGDDRSANAFVFDGTTLPTLSSVAYPVLSDVYSIDTSVPGPSRSVPWTT